MNKYYLSSNLLQYSTSRLTVANNNWFFSQTQLLADLQKTQWYTQLPRETVCKFMHEKYIYKTLS